LLPPLPLLTRRGEHEEWDTYLDLVYGNVRYPVDLGAFEFFYRCSCTLRDPHCRPFQPFELCKLERVIEGYHVYELDASARTEKARANWSEQSWRSSCHPAAAVMPLRKILPKGWTHSLPLLHADGTLGRAREAFVAPQKGTMRFERPEFWFAAWGFWVWPRPRRECLASGSWVEVIRLVVPDEHKYRKARFFFHAPGSGMWLSLGNSLCCIPRSSTPRGVLERMLDSDDYTEQSRPRMHGACSPGTRLETQLYISRQYKTLQLEHNLNLLEIRDFSLPTRRPSGTENACAGDLLRAGWNASRECWCDRTKLMASCVAGGGRPAAGVSVAGQGLPLA